jgi:hypothetical protein
MRVRLALLIVALFVAPLAAQAQVAGKVYKIGLLTLGSDPTRSGFWQRFLEAMRELNYVEGRNLIVKRAFADSKAGRLPGLVTDLVQRRWTSLSRPLPRRHWLRSAQPPQSPSS